jgi:general secretion pathway protein D
MQTLRTHKGNRAHQRPAISVVYLGKRHALTALLILVGALLILTGCATDKYHYLQEGHRYAEAGEWDKCVSFFQKAAEQAPDNAEILLMLRRAKFEASRMHLARGENYMAQELFNEATEQFRISMAFNPANVQAAKLSEQAKRRMDARHLLKQGQNFLRTGKYDQALEAFKQAVNLDPDYAPASKALAFYLKKEGQRPGKYGLPHKSDGPVSFKFKNTPIINVFEVLTKLSGLNFIFDQDMKNNKVTMFMTDVSLDRFIDVLLRTNDLNYIMVNNNTMIIYPDTPQKAKEYEDLQIKTFYLSNLEAKQAVGLLSKILQSKDIIANEILNSVVIRGSKEVIDIASKIIEANDGLPAEVLLDVQFLEVNRTLRENLGLTFSESLTMGIGDNGGSINPDTDFVNNISLYALKRISSKDIILSTPQATLNLLKQDGDTRILAQPKIRVRNAEKAYILLGERVPLQVNRRVDSNTGDVTQDYQYQDVGVSLEAEPMINMHDEITLKLTMEVSALGENLGTPLDPQYIIRTRTARSVLSLRDGETVIIGGLINDTERRTLRKVPLLGDFPAIGSVFSNKEDDNNKTDVLMVITPVVVRSLKVPATQATDVWSGSASRWSVEAPYGQDQDTRDTYLKRPREGIFDVLPSEDAEPSTPAVPPAAPAPQEASPQPPLSEVTPDVPNATSLPAPPPAAETGSFGTVWPPEANYSIHVGSYIDRREAQNRAQTLAGMRYVCFLLPAQVPRKGFFHRIFIGAYPDAAAANRDLLRFRERPEFSRDIHVVDRQWALGKSS